MILMNLLLVAEVVESELNWASILTWAPSLLSYWSLLVPKAFMIISKVPKYNIINNIIR
jgi:hypothetical protein